MTAIYVDADACPVKNEIYRVAERYGLKVYVVSNSWLGVPRDPRVELVVVSDGFDAADNWIAERAGPVGAAVIDWCPVSRLEERDARSSREGLHWRLGDC